MAYSMRAEDILDGVSNFNAWKSRLLFIMEDSDLEIHLKNDPPEAGDDASKVKYKKEESRAKKHHAAAAKEEEVPPQEKHDHRDFYFLNILL